LFEKFFDGQTNVTNNLPKKDRRDVSAWMTGNGRPSSVNVAELLVAPFLASLCKPEAFEDGNNFRWF